MTRPRVLLLGGSHARPSHTCALLRAAERALSLHGASTCRWEVGARPLPPVLREPSTHEEAQAVRALRAAAATADALVIATPLYHGSYAGCVKDALDHLSIAELEGKPIALLGHSGTFPATQALDHLRGVARSLRALAVPRQVVSIDKQYQNFGDRYVLADADVERRLAELARELLSLIVRLAVQPRPMDQAALPNLLERRADGKRPPHNRGRVVQRS